jgi:hypothetical protein
MGKFIKNMVRAIKKMAAAPRGLNVTIALRVGLASGLKIGALTFFFNNTTTWHEV